ncbi:LLM class flavin-dependent oxidoreductase [Micropruina sonneratiae]|uniref:LLM class flavin-dependent oxidoreductase n=1 Tax=Micropruina sonneratiae TaxID=2986940 RepID=UPI0022276AF5|nr:LLM class flavin-dependent oxidoreductase [Micropruina sp. KQZ13P-5]MCW3157623.1 LLM class flavin-dependent oxidoreductase [Micropruina sp. KQZ13P-5]
MTKKIGFLSFGHHRDVPGSRVRTPGAALRDHIGLAEAAEAAGLDGAWLRVHHFDHSLSAPFPLLAAMAARTSRIEVGTGVVDLRYENPLYLAEEAAATDLISAGRLQLGISRGSPEPAADGQAAFGYTLAEGEDWGRVTRRRAELFRRAIGGGPVARSQRAVSSGRGPDLPISPVSPGLAHRIWWGAGSHATGVWAGQEGYNLLSSTLLLADDGRPFHIQQADQVRDYRAAFAAAGGTGGQAAVTRSVFPITTDEDRQYFGLEGGTGDGVGFLDGTTARSGPTFAGSPERVAAQLAADEAVQEADYVLFALPSMLGVEYNAHLFENLAAVARDLGWKE